MTLLVIVLGLGLRWLAVQAAGASAQRALEIMQSPDGTVEDATAVADRLARSSRSVTSVTTDVAVTPDLVTVTVTVTSVLGTTVARSASGPRLRFVPQPVAPERAASTRTAPLAVGGPVPAGAGRTS
ncbi:hypothetical protein E0F15_16490 [Frankia sp. B2]|uniref:hypothetical protein n=1 Tax=Frankia TaxID=1854 RepID=UPI00104137F3|nr:MULTISPECIES: hypothetical protein [Frankia]TFE27408.1 hypothetical protein E0F15_16490 [Frankia sp. B2]